MEYRRSIELIVRFLKRLLAALFLLGVIAALLKIGPTWLRDRRNRDDIILVLLGLETILLWIEHRVRTEPPNNWQPSAAVSGTVTVALTGLIAAVATGWNARRLSDLVIPLAIMASTAILGRLVYGFAKRNGGQIGEARFKTTKP